MPYASAVAMMDLMVEEVEAKDLRFTSGLIRDVFNIAAPIAMVGAHRTFLEVVSVPFGFGLGEDKAEVLVSLSGANEFRQARKLARKGAFRLEVRSMSSVLEEPRLRLRRATHANERAHGIFGYFKSYCAICIRRDSAHDLVVVQFC